MKIGLSSYSLSRAIAKGELGILEAIDWVANAGGEHIELVPGATWDSHTPGLVEKIVARAKEAGIDLSSYTIGANFIQPDDAARAKEVARIKAEVDIAGALGVKFMRYDAGSRPIPETSLENFEKDLPVVADCCREVAAYAAKYGITCSVENHGYHFQNCERVRRLVNMVNLPNYRTTLDVGNFMCADGDSVASVRSNIDIASFIHFKDFFRRTAGNPPLGEGWMRTRAGHYLRATVIGHGSVELVPIAKIIKESGYDGYISVEFEGKEDCLWACKVSLDNAKKLFAEA
ncbi:MAG: sugar phosphate isomerase/epimerase [Lentisphaerae bacterium]|nr:sugar phosphate isomerase/epimerase [Lentisphaerota bacterium]